MTEPTLFDDTTLIEEPIVDAYNSLVGEGKKFSDNETLAKSKIESDRFIERLKAEQAQLRQELATRIKYEEFLDRLNSKPRSNEEPQVPAEPASTSAPMNLDEIERRLEQKLEQRDQEKRKAANLELAKQELSKALGPNYGSKVKQRATELEVSESFLTDLAANNPKAFLKLVGVGEAPKGNPLFDAPPRPNMNTDAFRPTGGNVKGKSYYDDLYKKDKDAYFSPKVMNAMYKDIEALGIDVFNNS
jgi:hypothetical protein